MFKENKVMFVSVISNISLTLVKIVAGILGNSGALVADGIHSLSDLITDFVAIVGNVLSRKKPNKKHPLGYGQVEYLASIFMGGIVLMIGFFIISGAFNDTIDVPDIVTLLVTGVVIAIKIFTSYYIYKKGKEYDNSILIASGNEGKAGVVSSIIVYFSIVLMLLSDRFKVLKYADLVAIIIVGIFVVHIGYKIVRSNVSSMLGRQVEDKEFIKSVKDIILNTENVVKIDKFHLLKYGPYYKLFLEVTLPKDISVEESRIIINEFEKNIAKFDSRINYINTEINPEK